ncbi:phage tail tape measure protein [Clostridium niameyense]|uniref:phage tail tape measure protein n=1 Tax=Clostridium niameyense TaxID=1622073 RepID=UPI00067EAEA3|nr:phage tail tape measure protein [Clostridium niameyense]
MASNIKGITIEIGGNTGPLDKALKNVNKTSRDLQSELKGINKQLKLDPTNTTLLTQKQKLLAESVTNTRSKLDTLKEAEKQVQEQFKQGKISEEQYRALQREVIKTENKLKSLENQASKSNATLNKISKTAEKVGNAAGKIGDKMMPATAAIAGAGAVASKFSIDFENSVAKTSTIANESEVSIGDLRKGILKLSDDTGIAATEISNNVYDAISAGQKTGDAVNFVANSTKLAKAGFAESGQSLDILTTIMNSYGMKAEEVTKVSDVLITTQNLGKVTVGELSSSMGKVIPTANTFGVNLQQVASGYAIMTSKGVKAAETTTYMNSMLNEMGKNGTKASDALKKASGKTFPELIKSGKSVGDTLNIMNEYAKKNNLSLSDMFGSAEAGKAALLLSNNAGKDFNDMLKNMNNTAGATDKAFKKVNNTTGEKLKKSINQLKNDAIKLGDSIAPIIQKLSNLAGILAKKLSGLSKGQLDMIVKIGLIVAAIGPIAKVVQGITLGVKGLTIALGFLMGHPIIVIIVGIVAAITLLVIGIKHLWNTNEGFRSAIINIWKGINKIIGTVSNAIVKFFTKTIPDAFNSLINFFKGIPAWFNGLWTGIKTNTKDIWNSMKEFFINLWEGIKQIFNSSLEGITSFVMNKFGFLIDGIKNVFDGVKEYFSGVWEVIKNIFLGAILIVIDICTGNFSKLNTDLMQIWDNIKEGFSHIWNGITKIFTTILEVQKQIVISAWNGIKNITMSIWNGICSFLSNLWNNLKTMCINTWNNMCTSTINLCHDIKQGVINIWTSILNWFTTLPSRLYNLAVNMFTSMKNGVINTGHSIIEGAKNIGTNIITAFENLPSKMLEIGKNIIDGLLNGITSGVGKVVDAAKNLGNSVSNKIRETLDIHSPSRVTRAYGQYTSEGLALGILDNLDKVKEASEKATNVVKNILSDKVIDVKIKTNTNENEIKDRLARQLNWGANHRDEYQKYLEFVDKLNKEEVEKSKDYLKEDYENRVTHIENRLRILKNENKIELQTEKARIDSQIAYYQKLQKNTQDKNAKNTYANKLYDLRQYQKQVLNSTKAVQEKQIYELERSKNALKEYYDNGFKLLDKKEKAILKSFKTEENSFKDLMITYNTAIKQLSIKTGDLTKDLENQQAIVVLQSKKIEALRKRYEKLAYTFGATAEETIKVRKEFEDARIELDNMANAVSEANKKISDNINKFQNQIINSLKERYSQELKFQEDKINKELENLNKWKDESIKRINDVYNAKIKALDDELKAEEKADKDKEELNKIHSLEDALKFEHNEFNKAELQKELNRSIAQRNKRLHREDIENKKNTLEQKKQNEVNSINNLYDANKNNLEKQLSDTKKFYDEKLKMTNLQAESEKLIVSNNQAEIVKLIKSYDKDYENAGKTLGERLADGMKEKINPVIDMIKNIGETISSIRTDEIQTAIDKANYNPISNIGNNGINKSTTNTSNTVVNNNITFNSPKALSPSEQRSKTETTLRNLAFGM